MELELQNAIIGLKNVTIGLPELDMGQSHLLKKKKLQENVTIGL